jgi:primary-amine oxidase
VGEHWILYQTLRKSGNLDSTTQFLYAGLNEPPKAEVLAWRPGAPFRREARVHLVQSRKGFEAVVDLANQKVLAFRPVTDRQYMVNNPENGIVNTALMANPEFKAGLTRRGISDLSMLQCFPINHGYFDRPEERGRRLARVSCWNRIGSLTSWGTPIGGLSAVVDLTSGQVVRVNDDGRGAQGPALMGEHHAEALGIARAELPAMVLTQPMGPGYRLDGQQVSWEGWKFHFRVDPRRGLVLSQVRHLDGERERSVIYQASLSELFVPYQNPAEPWNHQSYYDLGSYPSVFGGIASTMDPGRDCPPNARYFDANVMTPDGSPTQRPRVACLFERPGSEPAWRHNRDGIVESRARRDLVLRMLMGAGNYDYLFDWIFKQDGSIRVNMGATGIDQVETVSEESAVASDASSGGSNGSGSRLDRYGRFVAPYQVAVNHSHFFNFRLDFDIDGERNTLLVDRLETERLPESNPRRSVWRVNSLEATREADAKRMPDMGKPEFWRVVNPSGLGPLGYPAGYMLEGHGAMTLLSDDDYMRRRAGFTDFTLWATPYSPAELFAAGDYPTASVAGQGLPEWTRQNRAIANTDIVLWYTIGFHHVARPEDWPILPFEMHGFDIKPSAFFRRNPSIDLPK